MDESDPTTLKLIEKLIPDENEREIMNLIVNNKTPEEIIEIMVKKLSGELHHDRI